MNKNFTGIIFIAWRCLYAEITAAHIEDAAACLPRALARTLSMTVTRLNSWGEFWKSWVAIGQFLNPPRVIAERYRKCQVLTHEEDGSYTESTKTYTMP